MKLDVDGSSQGNPGKIGFGGIIRNNFMVASSFYRFGGIRTNLLPEPLGIKHGLSLAWN